MKRDYCKPTVKENEIEVTCAFLDNSPGEIETGGSGKWDANGRRGKWGNLWDDQEEE